MLLDETKYKAPPTTTPSVKGFKEWLERQPGDRTFYFGNPTGCALDQYLVTLGTNCLAMYNSDQKPLYLVLENHVRRANHGTFGAPTFGDILAEIEKAGI